jgi:hypothetical protein
MTPKPNYGQKYGIFVLFLDTRIYFDAFSTRFYLSKVSSTTEAFPIAFCVLDAILKKKLSSIYVLEKFNSLKHWMVDNYGSSIVLGWWVIVP